MEPLALSELAGDLPRPGVLCTLARVVGSAPQAPGAKMWVWADGFKGTIGGGRFEAEVIAESRRVLAAGRPDAFLKEYTLCREMGQCCGGKATIFFEPCPRKRAVHVFGAGHVARALSEVLAGTGLEIVVADSREEWADKAAFPAAVRLLKTEPLAVARAAQYGPDDAVVILTHDHDLDFELTNVLLPKPVGWLGLIGSVHKSRVFRARLTEPLRALWDEKMRCPIGRKLPTKSPKAIGVVIAAELLERFAYRGAAGGRAVAERTAP